MNSHPLRRTFSHFFKFHKTELLVANYNH